VALADLVLALEREATTRMAQVRAEATAQAEQLRAEGRDRLARRRSADLVGREVELRGAAMAKLDAARRDASLRALTARATALSAILAKARAALAETAPAPAMQRAVLRDCEAALECLGGADAVVACRPGWRAWLETGIAPRTGVRLETRAALGPGLVVQSADGLIDVDATLDSRLTRLWPVIEIELLRQLASPG
jgi:vacuolar-type H+-ATPase subunit E/Vma4